jgi:hypothetical protein
LEALHMVLAQRHPVQGLLHHSDRGSQYASTEYQQLLTKYGIRSSMSRRGNCWDNAVAESFFATLKLELVYQCQWHSRTQARSEVFEYIERFYNRRRRHSALGYLCPAEFERRYHGTNGRLTRVSMQSGQPQQIASDVRVSQTRLRRLGRSVAWVIRYAVVGGLILFFFTFRNEFIYLAERAFIGFFTGPIVWLLKSLAILATVYVLAALMSSRKTPVLYLRRFGLSDANRTIAQAINGGLGRQYRVITLDDSDFVPLEVPRIERILSRFGIPFALLVFFLAVDSLTGGQGL